MRKKILVGNWKMNKNLSQTGEFLKSIKSIFAPHVLKFLAVKSPNCFK